MLALRVAVAVLLLGSAAFGPETMLAEGPPRAARASSAPSGRSALTTDKPVYRATESREAIAVTIRIHYANASRRPRYFPTCRGSPPSPVLEKKVGTAWVVAYAPIDPMCLDDAPLVVAPGESYDLEYHVLAFRSERMRPKLNVSEVPGTYRIRWRANDTWEPGAPLLGRRAPQDEFVSNTFRIED